MFKKTLWFLCGILKTSLMDIKRDDFEKKNLNLVKNNILKEKIKSTLLVNVISPTMNVVTIFTNNFSFI
jgi:hypothetical protein